MSYYLYILCNNTNTVLYLGVINDLKRRVLEHKEAINEGFTENYKCKKLFWIEEFKDIRLAIEQEKRMKKWKREFNLNLINQLNPNWNVLYEFL